MSPVKRPKSKPRTKAKRKVKFLYKSSCASCRKAKTRLQRKGVLLDFRDLVKHRLTAAEIETLIGAPRSSQVSELPQPAVPPEEYEEEAAVSRPGDSNDGQRPESDSAPGDCGRRPRGDWIRRRRNRQAVDAWQLLLFDLGESICLRL